MSSSDSPFHLWLVLFDLLPNTNWVKRNYEVKSRQLHLLGSRSSEPRELWCVLPVESKGNVKLKQIQQPMASLRLSPKFGVIMLCNPIFLISRVYLESLFGHSLTGVGAWEGTDGLFWRVCGFACYFQKITLSSLAYKTCHFSTLLETLPFS